MVAKMKQLTIATKFGIRYTCIRLHLMTLFHAALGGAFMFL